MSGAKILWHSNAPWASTGYGTQTALFGTRAADLLGYDVAFSAFYGLKGNRISWQAPSGSRFTVYPGTQDPYANDVIVPHAQHWMGDDERGFVFTLTDPWVLQAEVVKHVPTLAWIPIDHDPVIPLTQDWLNVSGAIPLAMSRFGERVFRDAGYDPLYCPHGFDSAVYRPADDRAAVREMLQLPKDAFIVGMVAANVGTPSRKGFSEALQAFARFHANHPDAILYLHTVLNQAEGDGENIPRMCERLGIQVLASDQYGIKLGTPAALVAMLMQSFDVLINPSYGEGFGCTMIESQACGTPVITTDYSASPEVAPRDVGNWCVDGQRRWTWFDSWQVTPYVDALEDALCEAYDDSSAERLERRENVAAWAREYDADKVSEDFLGPALAQAVARFATRRAQQVRKPRYDQIRKRRKS